MGHGSPKAFPRRLRVRSSSVVQTPAEAALNALVVHGYNIRRYLGKLQSAEVKHG